MAKILVVDDEEYFCQVLANVLRKRHEVDVALNIDAAERYLSHASPDLVLLDAVLRGESGIGYLRRIMIRDPNLKVLVVTARLDEETEEEALRSGAIQVVHKPIQLQAFIATISKLVEGAQGNSEDRA